MPTTGDMRLVGTDHLEPGAVLARDVLAGKNGSVSLLRRGIVLDRRFIGGLQRAGIHAVYVDDELGRGIEVSPLLSEQTRSLAADALAAAFEQTGSGNRPTQALSDETLGQMAAVVELLVAEVAQCGDAVVALHDLAAANAYTFQHSIDVTALGLLIGQRCLREQGWVDFRKQRRMDGAEERLAQFGLGLMLHDIGKLFISEEILSKPGPLDETEWEIVRQHPLAGLGLLSPETTSALARVVVRSHHERWDGDGYPDGKCGNAIHQFARIASVADVYDAVTSERPYRRAGRPQDGWHVIVDGAGSAFDPEVVSVFRRIVAPYPPGCEIVLDDGRRGVVVSVPPDALDQPRVRIGWDAHGKAVEPYELDLEQLPGRTLVA
jgi:HD-GYP domain-containing protein (c-di-GMP phosphodiesterase class II)